MSLDAQRTPNARGDVSSWSDARLLAAACGAEENPAALDALVRRHASSLQRRCAILTQDRELAADLAQDTWTRMLRARTALRADGSFAAYLATIALNVWRDGKRGERRAHELSEHRLLSVEASDTDDADDRYSIAETVPGRVSDERAMLLRLDLSYALDRLPPHLRDVVIARHVHGESAAEIGRRVGRTEQTVTAWLRQATTRMQEDLREWRPAA
jgi:RNA polymerase sigma-70 factor (ECF subfamily)